MFLEANPCFQRAHVFCMDLQPAADPYNVVCKPMHGTSSPKSQLKSTCLTAKFGRFLDLAESAKKDKM